MNATADSPLPTRFGFLLLRDFTLMSVSAAIEPLRMANRICQEEMYSWTLLSETGEAVQASDGVRVQVDAAIGAPRMLDSIDAVIVCGGEYIERNTTPGVIAWLRSAARLKKVLGAVCTASYALAEAGLLDGYRCSIHWENFGALSNLFPGVAVSRNLFCIDRDRYTSSGGTAPTDMMLHLIGATCGDHVSAGVAEYFVRERIRRPDELQKVPLKHMTAPLSRKLIAAIELMEANIREPISQQDLADYAGLSRRQLQRLFQRYLASTPSRYYLRLRLHRARELLRQTNMSLVEISELTGFDSSSHFSRTYKAYYGHSPSTERVSGP